MKNKAKPPPRFGTTCPEAGDSLIYKKMIDKSTVVYYILNVYLYRILCWSLVVNIMVYDLSIPEKQVEYLRTEKSHFCAAVDEISNKLCTYDFIRINSVEKEQPKIIAQIVFAEQYTCADNLINSRIFQNKISSDEIKENMATEINNLFLQNSKILGIWLYKIYCDDNPKDDIVLFAIIKFLYHSIMFFRHLPLSIKFFKYKLEQDAEKRLLAEIKNIESLLAILLGKEDFENYLTQAKKDYKENLREDIEIPSLFILGEEYSQNTNFIINDIRVKLIAEIESQTKEIIKAYEDRNYTKIRDIGYEIHNIPEMIRNMYDWRLEQN